MNIVKKWVLTIYNNDMNRVVVERLEGTREQVVDYVKGRCFSLIGKDKLSLGIGIAFGEIDTEDVYSCSMDLSDLHITLYVQIEKEEYLSLENRRASFSNYKDSSYLDSKEVKTVILKKALKECGLTDKKDVDEILNRKDLPQMLYIPFLGGCFVLYDDLEGCGYANKLLNHSDSEEANEEYANKLCKDYSSLKEVRIHYDDLKKFCIQLSSGKVLQAIF